MRLRWLMLSYAVIAIVSYFLFQPGPHSCIPPVPGEYGSVLCGEHYFAEDWFQITGYPEVVGFLLATLITVWWSKRETPTRT